MSESERIMAQAYVFVFSQKRGITPIIRLERCRRNDIEPSSAT